MRDIKQLFDRLVKPPGLFLSDQDLQMLSGYCYDPDCFEKVCELIPRRLQFKDNQEKARLAVKTAGLVEHLVVRGPSAWIDELQGIVLQMRCYLQASCHASCKGIEQWLSLMKEKQARLQHLAENRPALMELRYKAAELEARLIEKGKQKPSLPKTPLRAETTVGQRIVEGIMKIDEGLERMDEWIDRQIDKLIGMPPESKTGVESGIISQLQV